MVSRTVNDRRDRPRRREGIACKFLYAKPTSSSHDFHRRPFALVPPFRRRRFPNHRARRALNIAPATRTVCRRTSTSSIYASYNIIIVRRERCVRVRVRACVRAHCERTLRALRPSRSRKRSLPNSAKCHARVGFSGLVL